VDDHERWRRFFSKTLQKQPELQVTGEASDGLEAVHQAQELQPDLILLDIGLPSLNGIEAARRIRQVSPASRILFVSENRSTDIVEQALNTGASGYVMKSDANSELLPAIKAVLLGKRFVSACLAAHDLMTSDRGVLGDECRIEYNPYQLFGRTGLVSELLVSILEATAADFGTVQLFDPTSRVFRIVAQQGFQSGFLDYFDQVSDNKKCACGAAMRSRSRTVVFDVATDPVFSNETRDVLLSANVRSVQSTPLVDTLGKLVGILSTHYRSPGGATSDVLKQVDILAASFLARVNVSGRNAREVE